MSFHYPTSVYSKRVKCETSQCDGTWRKPGPLATVHHTHLLQNKWGKGSFFSLWSFPNKKVGTPVECQIQPSDWHSSGYGSTCKRQKEAWIANETEFYMNLHEYESRRLEGWPLSIVEVAESETPECKRRPGHPAALPDHLSAKKVKRLDGAARTPLLTRYLHSEEALSKQKHKQT